MVWLALRLQDFESNLMATCQDLRRASMRKARVLVILLFLATSSTALAATKVIKFGKLIDGTGGVFTNAVVFVEDDRVQRVATGNASMPSGTEVIDLSRYTGVPGLIDAHTHI
jgi:adenine deaminase